MIRGTIENLGIASSHHCFLKLFFLDLNSSVQRDILHNTLSSQVLNWTLGINMAIEHLEEVADGGENVVRDEDLWWELNNGG